MLKGLRDSAHWRRFCAGTLLVVVLSMLVAACGSSDSTSTEGGGETSAAGTEASGGGSGVEAAEALVAEGTAPKDVWNGPTESPAPVANKTVGIVPCSLALQGCARLAKGGEEAAKVLGWDSIVADGRAEAQATVQAINSLISQNVDAIYLAAVAPQDVADLIEKASNQGIAVVTGFTPDVQEYGGVATVRQDDELVGEYQGAFVISEGCGGIINFTSEENIQIGERTKGIRDFIEANGEGECEFLADESLPLAQTGPPEEPIVSSLLQRNAGAVNWFTAGFDAQLRPMLQAAESSGDTEIKGVSSDGDVESLELIREGKGQVATVGAPLEWVGWGAMDQLNRYFNEEDLAESEGIEPKLLVKDNLPPAGEPYDGDLDYRAEYEKLWGVG